MFFAPNWRRSLGWAAADCVLVEVGAAGACAASPAGVGERAGSWAREGPGGGGRYATAPAGWISSGAWPIAPLQCK